MLIVNKEEIKILNKKDYCDVGQRANACKQKLEDLQTLIDKNPNNADVRKLERATYKEYMDLCKAEEGLGRLKSRVQWLNFGDQNTGFFFKTVKKKSRIR